MNSDSSRWIPKRTIFFTRTGSHAYGTALPTSDIDKRGIVIAPKAYYYGAMLPPYAHSKVDKSKTTEDIEFTELRHFARLAADANPNVLELLFIDESEWVDHHPLWHLLHSERDLFLSTKVAHTFSGYAVSQLHRIVSHRSWLLDPPKAPPQRAAFGLREVPLIRGVQLEAIEAMIRKQLEEWEVALDPMDRGDQLRIHDALSSALRKLAVLALGRSEDDPNLMYLAAAKEIGLDDNVIEIIDREKRFRTAQQHWESYQNWKKNRNPARAALEEKFGYDTKHGAHVVRLLESGLELLETGRYLVRRPNADKLIGIRHGDWTFEALSSWTNVMEKRLKEVYQSGKSPLPRTPQRAKIDAIIMTMTERGLSELEE